ncbi:hypothetical protein ME9_00911 [Bartonella taylorii 8TBB]|uniref:Uncharacterized protein n=1 Tax=Bartonella taylorii 8TBB TaxID=1094560 RepID=A0A9P2W2R1_BARTA|nr:hypothetical protein ME9_00911 [Bartonella taylorii 8TBB]
MHEKIAHYQQRLQKIQTDGLNTTMHHQLLDELRKETMELAATLAAEIALQEGKDSPIIAMAKSFQRPYYVKKYKCPEERNDLAFLIYKKIPHSRKENLT